METDSLTDLFEQTVTSAPPMTAEEQDTPALTTDNESGSEI